MTEAQVHHEISSVPVPYILVQRSLRLTGSVDLAGAKNAVLVIMVSLILTKGRSVLRNVPASDDVLNMMRLLSDLGAVCTFDSAEKVLEIDTTHVEGMRIRPEIMKKMRASVLAMGP